MLGSWERISVVARESISSKEGWVDIVAISKASIARAKSIASKARAIAQPREAATSTAKAQAAKASVSVAWASIVVVAMAHGVRGGEFGLLFRARTCVWMSACVEGCLLTMVSCCC